MTDLLTGADMDKTGALFEKDKHCSMLADQSSECSLEKKGIQWRKYEN